MTTYKVTDAQAAPGGGPTTGPFYLNGRNNKRTGILFAARSALTFSLAPSGPYPNGGAVLVQGRSVDGESWIDIAHINTADWSAADGSLVASTTFTPMPQMRGGFKNADGAGTISVWVWIPD